MDSQCGFAICESRRSQTGLKSIPGYAQHRVIFHRDDIDMQREVEKNFTKENIIRNNMQKVKN